jgi:hypothetical protein
MPGISQPEDRFPSSKNEDMNTGTGRTSDAGAGGSDGRANRALEEPELDSVLQLLVERAQYITGATGGALALPRGDDMVCRASAGSSAPAVGARLQVQSGLTGESISRRQLLRCDNAETDPRVNLEACRALGIASIVVLPLFRNSGEVRGLIELFSDHPYAFEERDLIALERMADLTLTALDLAEQKESGGAAALALATERRVETRSVPSVRDDGVASAPRSGGEPTAAAASRAMAPTPAGAVPEAMQRMQKCASCGFPISDGRTVCLDCEKKNVGGVEIEKKLVAAEPTASVRVAPNLPVSPSVDEFVPAFLANAPSVQKSWLVNPVNILAIIVFIVGILVAIIVFR